jgi:hypothetical protein
LLQLDLKLPAILKGERQPADAAEWLALADLCQRPFKRQYAAAARFYAGAFAADTKWATDLKAGHRYNAARYAARAAAGEGTDADRLSAAERSGLRLQALTWLQADLLSRRKQLETGAAADRAAAQQALQHWQSDADLAGLRDAREVAKLTLEEQAACRKLWADVEALLKKAP